MAGLVLGWCKKGVMTTSPRNSQMVDWKPSSEHWTAATETSWSGEQDDHDLFVYRSKRGSWAWRVTAPGGLTVSGIMARSIRDAMVMAERTLQGMLGREVDVYEDEWYSGYCDD